MINNLFTNLEKRFLIFFKDCTKMFFDASCEAKQNKKEQGGTGLKILTPNQMLQRLPIALSLVKAGSNSESLLNEIRPILYSLCQSKKSLKKYITT